MSSVRFLGFPLFLLLLFLSTAVRAEPLVPFKLPATSELNRIQSAVLKTSRGDVYFELYPNEAPWHVANFKYLADKQFYNGLRFHLHRPGYIIQAGTPNADPDGGPGYSLPPEFNEKSHETGVLGMARMPDDLNPGRRSHGSQFHILLKEAPHLDGSFTVFGKIVEGLDVARSLKRGDRIEQLVVYVKPKP